MKKCWCRCFNGHLERTNSSVLNQSFNVYIMHIWYNLFNSNCHIRIYNISSILNLIPLILMSGILIQGVPNPRAMAYLEQSCVSGGLECSRVQAAQLAWAAGQRMCTAYVQVNLHKLSYVRAHQPATRAAWFPSPPSRAAKLQRLGPLS